MAPAATVLRMDDGSGQLAVKHGNLRLLLAATQEAQAAAEQEPEPEPVEGAQTGKDAGSAQALPAAAAALCKAVGEAGRDGPRMVLETGAAVGLISLAAAGKTARKGRLSCSKTVPSYFNTPPVLAVQPPPRSTTRRRSGRSSLTFY